MELVGLGCNWWEGTYPSLFFLLNSNVGHEKMARTKSAEDWICNVIKTGVSFKLEALTGEKKGHCRRDKERPGE